MNYNIDFYKLIDFFLFNSILKEKMRGLLRAFIFPIIRVHNYFINYSDSTSFDLKMSPQTLKLRWGLNEKFDSDLRRIYIIDNANNQIDYIFLKSENKPLYLQNYLGANTYEFEVRVPVALQYLETQIKAFLNAYKLPSKRYIITYE